VVVVVVVVVVMVVVVVIVVVDVTKPVDEKARNTFLILHFSNKNFGK
jgi:hypothetical protein